MEFLPLAEWWYNTNQVSPYELLYGQSPPIHIPYLAGTSVVEAVDRSLTARDAKLSLIKHNLHRAQNRMVQMANSHRSEREFRVGDWVYLKLQPFRQSSLVQQRMHKLSAKYAGPFQVLAKVGAVAYQLKLPASGKIYDVFHVSLLKLKVGDSLGTVPLPEALISADVVLVPEKILGRTFSKVRNSATMWLIKWQNVLKRKPHGCLLLIVF